MDENCAATSDIHHVLGEQDGGRADAQAPRTVPFGRGEFGRTDEEVGKPEIIDQRRPQHTGETQYGLVYPGSLTGPIRGILKACVGSRVEIKTGRCEGPAAVVRVTDKRRMRAGDAPVQARSELIAK